MAVAALAAAHVTARPQAQFTAATDAVLVDVLVTRDGKPATGLTAGDFTVTDRGVPQKITLAAIDSLPVRLLLALDTSASVRGEALELLKQAAKAAVESLRPRDEAALLSFAHTVSLPAAWTADRTLLAAAIDGVTARGSTALADAAFAGLTVSQQPGARTLMLLFTDGNDTASWLGPDQVLQAARRSEAIVYGVTVGPAPAAPPAPDQLELWLQIEPSLYRGSLLPVLARQTGGETMRANDMKSLRDMFVAIVSRFNSRYVLSYSPAGVPASGWHPLQVAVTGGGDVTARRGYFR